MDYKNKFGQYYIIGFVIFLIIVFLVKRQTKENFDPNNAADMCKKISSKSDEINAACGGISNVIEKALGWMSPGNYSSKNQTDNLTRNIINDSLSVSDITKINSTCENTSTVVQSNIINTSECAYCIQHGCDISGVNQSNKSTANQTCKITIALELLLKKSSDSNALALAKSLQDAQGLLTSNKSSTDVCNILNTDVTYESYTETLSKCSNTYSLSQDNFVGSCGKVTNLIQQNTADQFQECVLGVGITKDTAIASKVAAKSDISMDQKSSGITTASIISSVLCSCVVSIVIAVAIYMFSQSDNAKLLIEKVPIVPI